MSATAFKPNESRKSAAELQARIHEIEKILKRQLRPFIGKPANSDTSKMIAQEVKDVFKAHCWVEPEVCEVETIWQEMGWQEKLKWWVFNRVYPGWGADIRSLHMQASILYDCLIGSNKSTGEGESPHLPDYAQLHPEEIVRASLSISTSSFFSDTKVDISVRPGVSPDSLVVSFDDNHIQEVQTEGTSP